MGNTSSCCRYNVSSSTASPVSSDPELLGMASLSADDFRGLHRQVMQVVNERDVALRLLGRLRDLVQDLSMTINQEDAGDAQESPAEESARSALVQRLALEFANTSIASLRLPPLSSTLVPRGGEGRDADAGEVAEQGGAGGLGQ